MQALHDVVGGLTSAQFAIKSVCGNRNGFVLLFDEICRLALENWKITSCSRLGSVESSVYCCSVL